MLTGKKIYKQFKKTKVLKGINIEVAPGTITTIIGPSGCGKSTLLRSLALLDPPTSGTVILDDQTLEFPRHEPIPVDKIWPRLTVVFQQLFLWPHITIRENALLPLRSHGISDPEDRVDQIFRELGIDNLSHRYPNQLSLGQRQLGAIARSFALEPRYLLLDEITSALDVEYVAMILEFLKRLRDRGVALLLISHLIDFAKKSADQIVFMDGGTIIEQGSPKILENPQTDRLERFLGLVLRAR